MFVFLFNILNANILFYPRVAYFDANKKIHDLHIKNITNDKLIVKFKLGYTRVNKYGRFIEVDEKDLLPSDRSFCKKLKIFPKKIVLEPKTEQTIKVKIRNFDKQKYNKGEYYCRLYSISSSFNKKALKKSDNKGFKTIVNMKITFGVPLQIVTNKDEKIRLNIKSYGYKVKDNKFFYKVLMKNISTKGFRGIVKLKFINTKTNKIDLELRQSVVNQGGDSVVFLKNQSLDKLINGVNYVVKAGLYNKDSLDPNFYAIDGHIDLDEFEFQN